MDLSLHLVSNVNIYNLAFVSMSQTLKDIRDKQVSLYQQRILCDSLQLSIKRNTKRLLDRVDKVELTLKVHPNVVNREKTSYLLHLMVPYKACVLELERIILAGVTVETYEQCQPIFSEMEDHVKLLIEVMQDDLELSTKMSR